MRFKFIGILAIFTCVSLLLSVNVFAQSTSDNTQAYFEHYVDIENIDIIVPTIVEIPFTNDEIDSRYFTIQNLSNANFEPGFYKIKTVRHLQDITLFTSDNVDVTEILTDEDIDTYTEFDYTAENVNTTQITLKSNNLVTASRVNFNFSENVTLPNTITIETEVEGIRKTVLSKVPMRSTVVTFPRNSADTWFITLEYSQPLRISEINLIQENVDFTNIPTIRFLAQPNTDYRIYLNAKTYIYSQTGESPDLANIQDVLEINHGGIVNNPLYLAPDQDDDSIQDEKDNCPSIPNSDQLDVNKNSIGDACEDFDRDRIINARDNCVDTPNRNQRDSDGDGYGDACDSLESRLTEQYPWLPWTGIGFAGIVMTVLFYLTAKSEKPTKETDSSVPLENSK